MKKAMKLYLLIGFMVCLISGIIAIGMALLGFRFEVIMNVSLIASAGIFGNYLFEKTRHKLVSTGDGHTMKLLSNIAFVLYVIMNTALLFLNLLYIVSISLWVWFYVWSTNYYIMGGRNYRYVYCISVMVVVIGYIFNKVIIVGGGML